MALPGTVSVTDRGFLYGDGLFETIAVQASQPLLLDLHLSRLLRGCERLDIPIDVATVRDAVLEASENIDLGVIRVSFTRGQGGEGYTPPKTIHPNLLISSRPLSDRAVSNAEQGIETGLSEVHLAYQPLLAGLKHMNRLEQVMAQQRCPAKWPEVIMTNADGGVIEGSFSNIFLLGAGNELITPDLSLCGVAGVIRETIINLVNKENLANKEHQPVEIRSVPVDELYSATEIFFTNSVIGIWPVRKLGSKVLDIGFSHNMHAKLKHISAVVNA